MDKAIPPSLLPPVLLLKVIHNFFPFSSFILDSSAPIHRHSYIHTNTTQNHKGSINMNRNMGSTALKRLMTEYRELTLHAPEGITAGTTWETGEP